jgi:hypothetical protein
MSNYANKKEVIALKQNVINHIITHCRNIANYETIINKCNDIVEKLEKKQLTKFLKTIFKEHNK